jgi:cyanate permease
VTLFGGLLGLGAHGGYHAVMTWLPTFLKTERNLSVLNSGAYLAVIIFAFWCGCVASGYLIDRIGRRKNIVLFALCCVVTVQCYVFLPLTNTQMLFLGSRWGSSPPVFRPVWERSSTNFTLPMYAAPALAFATTLAGCCPLYFHSWSGT